LASVTFYEPQQDLDITYGPIDGELKDPDGIGVEELTAPMPNSKAPAVEALEDLVKVAFPVSRKERQKARETIESRRKPPPPSARPDVEGWSGYRARGGAAKKASAKKTAAKKTAAKKTATRKTATRKTAARKRPQS